MKNIPILIFIALFMSGCSGNYSKYSDSMSSTNMAQATLASTYFTKDAEATKEIVKALGKNEAAIALLMVIKKDKDAQIIELLSAKTLVAPTTANDVWKTVAENTIPTAIRWGAGAWAATEIFNNVGTQYNASGGSTITTNMENSPGKISNSYNTTSTDFVATPVVP